MSKNWLIRTKTNHILGPISKEKVLELLQNNSIKADDEICSGNGFWFYVREEDMVARFLLGREQQNFNPISEAKDVLTTPGVKPSQQEEDITMVGGIDLKRLNEKTPPSGTVVKNLNIDEMVKASTTPAPAPEPKKKAELARSTGSVKELPPRPLKPKTAKPPLKKQSYLQYLLVLCFLGLLAALWYRKNIIRYFKSADVTIELVSTAHAQDDVPAEKKKSPSAP